LKITWIPREAIRVVKNTVDKLQKVNQQVEMHERRVSDIESKSGEMMQQVNSEVRQRVRLTNFKGVWKS
jgi:uncharacterized protein Yka (UPF0111/DUF47 family)